MKWWLQPLPGPPQSRVLKPKHTLHLSTARPPTLNGFEAAGLRPVASGAPGLASSDHADPQRSE